jgi:FtsP/CotA-like multicopper oxidase with cupredoxin domain
VVANANTVQSGSPGTPYVPLFSFNGSNPGPTIRLRGDETLRIKLRNFLGRNYGQVPKGPAPDLFELPAERLMAVFCEMAKADGLGCDEPPPGPVIFRNFDKFYGAVPVELVDTTCTTAMVNVVHGSHTTNLHTHGLHVEPGRNPNGTEGDNTLLRIIPREDWEDRQRAGRSNCEGLGANERVAEASFEFPLGDVERQRRAPDGGTAQPHPPGTFWYHPHKHGATHDQVASGMAGFLIVEGDVDDTINEVMTGTTRPDVSKPSGAYDYRERLMMIQRVLVSSVDVDAGPRRNQGRVAAPTAVNGRFVPGTMVMRPGAVSRTS